MREQLASGFRVSNSGHDSGRESIVNTGLTQICVVRDLLQVDVELVKWFAILLFSLLKHYPVERDVPFSTHVQ